MGGDSPALPIARHIHVVATWNFLMFGVMMVLFGTVRANGAVWIPLVVLAVGMVPVRFGYIFATYQLARRRRDLDQLPGHLGDQPRARDRLLRARRLEEGADDGRAAPGRRRMHRGSAGDARAAAELSIRLADIGAIGARHVASFPLFACAAAARRAAMRAMLAEHRLHPSDFIWPLFVCDGRDCEEPIGSLPGVCRWSIDRIGAQAKRAADLGIPCIALFPNTPSSFAPRTRARR